MAGLFERSPILRGVAALRNSLAARQWPSIPTTTVAAVLMGYVGFVGLLLIAKFLVPT